MTADGKGEKKYWQFYSPKDNEWVKPVMKRYLLSCCDCGLVHEFNFKIVGDRIWFQARRHMWWTRMTRMMRAKRSGSNCICGAIVRSRKRRRLKKKQ